MKEILKNIFGFIYSLSMGDYFFFLGTFLLIVLFIYVLYLIKCSDYESREESNDGFKDEFDLEAVSKDIEDNYHPSAIKLTSYEEEQENNAIISYDELLNTKQLKIIGYDDEYVSNNDEIEVKKFDLKSISKSDEDSHLEVKLLSYEKEEAFLQALKQLQQNLSQ